MRKKNPQEKLKTVGWRGIAASRYNTFLKGRDDDNIFGIKE